MIVLKPFGNSESNFYFLFKFAGRLGYAWVTLATNDSYGLGALVLAQSLKSSAVQTKHQTVVLVTDTVTGPML